MILQYTDKDGYFSVKIKKESYSFIGIYKEGYSYPSFYIGNKEKADNHFSVPGEYNIRIEYEAECSFFPIFKKQKNNTINDTLKVYITNYHDPYKHILHRTYYGVSPFQLDSDFGYCTGNKYFYYKLEYTDNGTWKTKIDSVYVESFENYTDTIYY